MHWLQKALLGGQPLEKYGEDAGEHSLGVRTIHQYVVPDACVYSIPLVHWTLGCLREQLLFLYLGNMCH